MGEITPLFSPTTYYRVRLNFAEAPKKFYRELLVREDLDLFEVGTVFALALGAELEHVFYFKTEEYKYIPDDWLEDEVSSNELPMFDASIGDLGDKFTYIYTPGSDGWVFNGQIFKNTESINDQRKCIIVSAKGQGIWEDNIRPIRMMLSGELDPMCKEEDLEEDIAFPWNHEVRRFGDFFTGFSKQDIEMMQDILDEDLEDALCDLYDEDVDEMNHAVTEFVMQAFLNQLEMVPFVKSTFSRLSKKYDDETATSMMIDVFLEEYMNVVTQLAPYSQEGYKKKLKALK